MSKAVESLIMSIMDGNEGTYGKSGAPFTFQSGWQAADSDDMVCDLNVRYQTAAEWFEVYSKLRSFLERRLSEGDTVYIGVWKNPANGLTYIDRSYHFDNLGSALEFAECEGQLEIWDWTRSRSYTVEELRAGAKASPNNQATFVVEFDSIVWSGLTPEERSSWVDETVDAINAVAHVADVEVRS